MGKRKAMSPSRLRVLEAFRKDPYRSVTEFSEAVGISPAGISLHLIGLEQEGLIKRPRLVYDTSRQGSTPVQSSQRWVSGRHGAIERGEGAMKPRKARDADALQARIDQVVAKAQREGTCFSAEYVKLERLGACKCG